MRDKGNRLSMPGGGGGAPVDCNTRGVQLPCRTGQGEDDSGEEKDGGWAPSRYWARSHQLITVSSSTTGGHLTSGKKIDQSAATHLQIRRERARDLSAHRSLRSTAAVPCPIE